MTTASTLSPQLALNLELSEASCWSKLYDSNTPWPVLASTIAGAFAGAVPGLNILAMNRVIGLGMERPAHLADIDAIIRFYKEAGVRRFIVQLSPHVLQDDLPDLLRKKGFLMYNHWVKLVRSAAPSFPDIESELEVREIDAGLAKIYSEIIWESFGWENEPYAEWLAASVGKPGYQHYLVLDGSLPIAAGALHIYGVYASLALAGTLPGYRKLGAQTLLLSRRIQEAREAGCQYIVSETAEPTADKPVSSYNNMLRFGFEEAYRRPNWLFEF